MNILMVSQFYPPIMGGVERYIQDLALSLVQRGQRVSVVTLRHTGLPEFEEQDGVSVYRIRGTMQRMTVLFTTERQHAPPFPDPEITLGLRRVLAAVRPQIVHAHDWMVRSFLPIKAQSRAKLVRTVHDCELACVQMRFMFKDRQLCGGPSARKCLACAAHHYGPVKGSVTLLFNGALRSVERKGVDAYLPISRAVAQINGLPGGRVVPNFIPDEMPEASVAANSALVALPQEEFILQVGDLVPDKGVEVLLKAYAGLDNALPLVLIGRRLPQSPTDVPPGVTILDSVPHAAVMEAWRRSAFGIVASTCMDASPTVTLEAMACGRPVIGSRIGGIVDQIVDGVTGLLVPAGDVEALRQAMKCLIADAELRKRMGEAGLERIRQFRAGAVVSEIEAVYESLCAA